MSQENVELVQRGYAAWNRGDMDAMLALFDAEFEFVPSGVLPGLAPVYRGHQGWKDFWSDFRETWDSLQIEVNEAHDTGEHVVALLTFRARGRDGLEVHRQFANSWTLRNGLAVRLQAHGEWTTALEAAGLSE